MRTTLDPRHPAARRLLIAATVAVVLPVLVGCAGPASPITVTSSTAPASSSPVAPQTEAPVSAATSTPRTSARTPKTVSTTTPSRASGTTSSSARPKPAPTRTAPKTTASKAAAPRAAEPSGQTVPRGDLPHWRQIIAQDFSTPVALGRFDKVYSGWAGYDRNRDSSRGHRPLATQGLWNSKTTSSVKNGVFHCDLHTEGTTPQVCALTPTVTGRWWEGAMYGRYSVRFKADSTPDYKIAWLIWPSSNIWAQGELDFPEGYLNGTITAAAHALGDDPAPTPFFRDTGVRMQAWHTATTEWTPGRVTYILDGKRVGTTTDPAVVPTHPMRWALQAESRLTAKAPDPDLHAHISVDWVAQWSWKG